MSGTTDITVYLIIIPSTNILAKFYQITGNIIPMSFQTQPGSYTYFTPHISKEVYINFHIICIRRSAANMKLKL